MESFSSDQTGTKILEFVNQTNMFQGVTEPTRDKAILDLILSYPRNLTQTNVIEKFSTSDNNMIKFKIFINERIKN